MKLAVICFTWTGWETAAKICEHFERRGVQTELAKKSRYLPDSISISTGTWTGEKFPEADGILFVGACGIAVRSIAPYVASKKADPAVLVVDECGKYVISLLSGHLGGANDLAKEVAAVLDAIPVVTTATDLHERFAVDVFAKKNQCEIFPMTAAKEVSAALLSGQTVGFYSEFPWEGELPSGLIACDEKGLPTEENAEPERPKIGIAVTVHKEVDPFEITVFLVPKVTALGMGCRKGKDAGGIRKSAEETLEAAGIYPESLFCLASIDLKKEEHGLTELAKRYDIPFLTFTEEELLRTPGSFTPSEFVQKITGVDNVCERSAVRAAENGRLIRRKQGADGVTTALAVKQWRVSF